MNNSGERPNITREDTYNDIYSVDTKQLAYSQGNGRQQGAILYRSDLRPDVHLRPDLRNELRNQQIVSSAYDSGSSHRLNYQSVIEPIGQTIYSHNTFGDGIIFPVTQLSPPTLGQMAEQVQAKARADARYKAVALEKTVAVDDDDGEFDNSGCDNGTEHTGRWTKQEHDLFLEAIKKFGKEWKKVAAMVKTRTVVQTRTHAQKYFQKIQKSSGVDENMDSAEAPEASSKRVQLKRLRRLENQMQRSNCGGNSSIIDMHADKRTRVRSESQDDEDTEREMDEEFTGASGINDDLLKAAEASASAEIQSSSATHPSYNVSDRGFSNSLEGTSCTAVAPAESFGISIIVPTPKNLPRLLDNFPQPSPAACGTRKEAELAAAQVLAMTSSAMSLATLNSDGTKTVPLTKNVKFMSPADPAAPSPPAYLAVKREPNYKPSLSIINPDTLPSAETLSCWSDGDAPETPWETELKAYERNYIPSSVSISEGGAEGEDTELTTSAEKSSFLAELRNALAAGDVNLFIELMNKTEASTTSAPIASIPTETTSNAGGASLPTEIVLHSQPVRITQTAGRSPSHSLVSTLGKADPATGDCLLVFACSLEPDAIEESDLVRACRRLLEAGVSVTSTDTSGRTGLHRAAATGRCQVGRMLLMKGCPVNAVSASGDTAAHIAATHGQESFLELLAEFGANPHIRNDRSRAALDMAGAEVQELDQHGASRRSQTELQLIRQRIRRVMLTTEPRLRTLILYHDDCLDHSVRRPSDWEGPDRILQLIRRLNNASEFPAHEIELSSAFEKAGLELMGRVHSKEYLTFVNTLSKQVRHQQQQHVERVHGAGYDDTEGAQLPPPPPPALPFTPQVQKFMKRLSTEELKNSEYCDTAFSAGTLRAARRAGGAVAHAVDRVLLGRNRNCFCAVRPPGHHAGYEGLLDGCVSCGFCILNSVAAGAVHALEAHGCERVAIVDLDIHHGNGTEDIVRRYAHPSRLFFFSLHLFENQRTHPTTGGSNDLGEYLFYPGTGFEDDMEHNIINVPLMPMWNHPDFYGPSRNETRGSKPVAKPPASSVGREAYRSAITQRLLPSLRAFNPDLILLSMGFDAASGDLGNKRISGSSAPCKGMDLTPSDFEWVTTEVLKVADICCAGRVVSVLEGGYGDYAKSSYKAGKLGGLTHSNSSESNLSELKSGYCQPVLSGASTGTVVRMDRSILTNAAVAHVKRLVDPYG